MHEFCAEAADRIDPELPSSPEELNTLFQHLLYDDSHRMVFCYVPKNGCSNMKRLMLVLNGILPPESSLERRPPEPVLKQVPVTHMYMYTHISCCFDVQYVAVIKLWAPKLIQLLYFKCTQESIISCGFCSTQCVEITVGLQYTHHYI